MTTTLGSATTSHPPGDAGAGDRADAMVVPFSRARRSDVATIGGKGANLGEMTAAGLPVPPGFVLTIEAYNHFYADNELGPRVTAELSRLNADDPNA